jgi:hypothetical protein
MNLFVKEIEAISAPFDESVNDETRHFSITTSNSFKDRVGHKTKSILTIYYYFNQMKTKKKRIEFNATIKAFYPEVLPFNVWKRTDQFLNRLFGHVGVRKCKSCDIFQIHCQIHHPPPTTHHVTQKSENV